MNNAAPRRPDPAPHMIAAARAVAQTGQPDAALAALDKALAAAIGHKLFTVLVVNLKANENQRYYSNRPKEYPVGGAKTILRDSKVTQKVMFNGECHINYNYDDIKDAFFDHELIRSLGCESSINVPVRWNGETYGMINLLHESGWYSEADIPTLTVFAAIATPVVQHIVRGWKS